METEYDIDTIRRKAETAGWGYDGDNGTNDVILFLLSELDKAKRELNQLRR